LESLVDAIITGFTEPLWGIPHVKFIYEVVIKVVVGAALVGAAVLGLAIILKHFRAIVVVAKGNSEVVIGCWSHFI
jgi:hypothetical protein